MPHPLDAHPDHGPAGSVGFLLSKVGMCSSQRFAQVLAPLEIGPPHFALLRYVSAAEGRSQQALAAMLEIPPSRMVAFVDELERRGLVERRRNPDDRRAHALHLTAKGRRIYEKALAAASEYEQQLTASLGPKERDQLLGLLQRLAADQNIPVGVHPGLTLPTP